MILPVGSINRHAAGLAAATVGWILAVTSMGLVAWRVWHMDSSPGFPSGLACVGMWRVCIYHHVPVGRVPFCHPYSHHDAFLPPDILAAQHLLLAASILGLLGKAAVLLALRNVFKGILQENAAFGPFVTSGILYLLASACLSATVVLNYASVTREQRISFPPSFYLPDRPDAQEVGNASHLATVAALLLLLSGISSFSHRYPLDRQVHPDMSEL
ncbi:claudin-34-like [Dasypus novemcinctus]|uniref:claudin-34-like n=1 Tax=Dasypus novemcinctus TaxID=9361 RepID=UPI00265F22A1|nr:claudin-34-like [Dasypus novemcinctus]